MYNLSVYFTGLVETDSCSVAQTGLEVMGNPPTLTSQVLGTVFGFLLLFCFVFCFGFLFVCFSFWGFDLVGSLVGFIFKAHVVHTGLPFTVQLQMTLK